MDPVILDCPICGDATYHRVLKETENTLTVECEECGDVRSASPPRSRHVELRLIISQEGLARPSRMEVDPEEQIAVGDEFEHEGHRLIVTGMEFAEGKADKAKAADIHVLHAKVFDHVPLKVSVNENDITKSYRMDVRPEAFFQIGEVILVEGRKLLIKTLKSDQNRTLHRGGLSARHIVRVFCDPASPGAKVGEIGVIRRRGKAAGKPAPKKAPKRAPRAPAAAGPPRKAAKKTTGSIGKRGKGGAKRPGPRGQSSASRRTGPPGAGGRSSGGRGGPRSR